MGERIQDVMTKYAPIATFLEELSQLRVKLVKLLNRHLQDVLDGVCNETEPRELRSVDECLEAYEREDTATGYSMKCRECDLRPEVVSKRTIVLRAPQILILHIDRDMGNSQSQS